MKCFKKISVLGLVSVLFSFLLMSACQKDKYYFDGGKSDPVFKGTVLEYLKSKPQSFDTIVKIIQMADMEREFNEDTLTFFAPQDYSVEILVRQVNKSLFNNGKDTLKTLEDVDPAIWRKYLSNYIFKGANKLKDYPQLDVNAKGIYPGQNYVAYNGEVFNIGVNYYDAGGVKYSGYRQLMLSYIPDLAQPLVNWISIPVSSSDVQPYHAVVHILNATYPFGADPQNLAQDVLLTK
jgi:hypothetical protein